MKKRQRIPEQTKRKIVNEVLSGAITKEQAQRIYNLKGKSAVLSWMRKFAGLSRNAYGIDPIPILLNGRTNISEKEMESEENKMLKARIKELEKELEFAELKSRAYQVMVEIAKKDYGLDLGKKSGAKQSANLKKKSRGKA